MRTVEELKEHFLNMAKVMLKHVKGKPSGTVIQTEGLDGLMPSDQDIFHPYEMIRLIIDAGWPIPANREELVEASHKIHAHLMNLSFERLGDSFRVEYLDQVTTYNVDDKPVVVCAGPRGEEETHAYH